MNGCKGQVATKAADNGKNRGEGMLTHKVLAVQQNTDVSSPLQTASCIFLKLHTLVTMCKRCNYSDAAHLLPFILQKKHKPCTNVQLH